MRRVCLFAIFSLSVFILLPSAGAQDEPPIPEGASAEAITALYASLASELILQGHDAGVIGHDVVAIADVAWRVRGVAEGAYPGSGVVSVVVDHAGLSYGSRGEHDIGELIRALGWLETAPDLDILSRLIDAAQMSGMGAVTGESITLEGGVLSFDYVFRNGPVPPIYYRLTLGAEGVAEIVERTE